MIYNSKKRKEITPKKPKLSKFVKLKIDREEKQEKIEKEKIINSVAKTVKNKNLNIKNHVVIDESVMRNRLILASIILVFIVSVFSVIFQFARIVNMKNMIVASEEKIILLEDIENNIDYYNELFAYNKLFKENNFKNLNIVLSELWHYSIKINDELLTNENYEELTTVNEGEQVTVELFETMDEAFLPYLIASKGNAYEGDPGDKIENHFYNNNNSTLIEKTFSENKNYTEIGGRNRLVVNNILTYKFTKGSSDVNFKLFVSLLVRFENILTDDNENIFKNGNLVFVSVT